LVEDNIYWKGLDSHAGDTINFYNNYVRNCFTAIEITRGGMPFSPLNCKIINNHVIGIPTGGAGINVTGIADGELARNNTVSGNTISGTGITGNSTTAGIRCAATENTIVSNNIIEECESSGIIFHLTNKNFMCEGNIIRDIWSDSLTATGIFIDGYQNTGVIGSNSFFRRNTALGTNVGTRPVRINPALIDETVKLIVYAQNNDGWISEFLDTGENIHNVLTNQIPINLKRGYQLWTEDVGTGTLNSRVWFEVPTQGSAYFGSRSGGRADFMRFAADDLRYEADEHIMIGRVSINDASELIINTTPPNIDGSANSGNSARIGISYSGVSDGLSTNYPSAGGTVFLCKASNLRTFRIFANTSGEFWMQSLHTADNNTWQKLVTDAPSDGNRYVRRNGAWEILP
jgi:hypothetical protein